MDSPADRAPAVVPGIDVAAPTPARRLGALHRLAWSFGYAFRGIWYAARTQRNVRIHLVAAALALGLGLLLGLPTAELAIVVLCIALVIAAEAANTALELLADAAVPAWHPLVKHAKDVAAGAVLVTAIGAAVVAGLLFGPRLARIFGWVG